MSAIDSFLEKFALGNAAERTALVESLPAGSSKQHYYKLLLKQFEGELDDDLLQQTIRRYGLNKDSRTMRTRAKLLSYTGGDIPDDLIEFLKSEINPQLAHTPDDPQVRDAQTDDDDEPSVFPEFELMRKINSLVQGGCSGVTGPGFDALASLAPKMCDLPPTKISAYLKQLQSADAEGVVAVLAKALQYSGRSFELSSYSALTSLLTRQQLAELGELAPNIARSSSFLALSLAKLAPSEAVHLPSDAAARAEYIASVAQLVQSLAPPEAEAEAAGARNLFQRRQAEAAAERRNRQSGGSGGHVGQLQAAVAMLQLQEAVKGGALIPGTTDGEAEEAEAVLPLQQLLLSLLSLPLAWPLANQDRLRAAMKEAKSGGAEPLLQLSSYWEVTSSLQLPLPSEGETRSLVRDCLFRVLSVTDDPSPFEPFLHAPFLAEQLATARLRCGRDPEGGLSAAALEAAAAAVEVEFYQGNQQYYSAASPVTLHLRTLGCDRLLVKLFEVNTTQLYRSTGGAPITTSLNLDGLVAGSETTITIEKPAAQLVHHALPFPSLTGRRGVFVVEVIGGGLSSRAVLRKGGLRCLHRLTPGGHALRIVDESNTPVPPEQASVWLSGREFVAAEGGAEIFIPYAASPSSTTLILTAQQPTAATATASGDNGSGSDDASAWSFSAPWPFQHQAEELALSVGLFVPREALLRGNLTAQALVRASLTLNGQPAPLSLLRGGGSAHATLTLRDSQGSTSLQFPNLKLSGSDATPLTFAVPASLREVSITLRAEAVTAAGTPVQFRESRSVTVNGIDDGSGIASAHLRLRDCADGSSSGSGSYVVCVLGKAGEAMAGVSLSVAVTYACLSSPQRETLRTNAQGEVVLGPLLGATTVAVSAEQSTAAGRLSTSFALPPRALHSYPPALHLTASQGPQARLPLPFSFAQTHCMSDPAATGSAPPPLTPLDASLLQYNVTGGVVANLTSACLSRDGPYLLLSSLPQGSYTLRLKAVDTDIQVVVAPSPTPTEEEKEAGAGEQAGAVAVHGFILSGNSQQQQSDDSAAVLSPLCLGTPTVAPSGGDSGGGDSGGDSGSGNAGPVLSVAVHGATPSTRVHLLLTATAAAPLSNDGGSSSSADGASLLQELQSAAPQPAPLARARFDPTQSNFVSGRRLGDEYSYILARKQMGSRAGNMLERPSMLLTPWAVRKTETDTQSAASGNNYGSCGGGGYSASPSMSRSARRRASYARGGMGASASPSPSLDFLPGPCVTVLNLGVCEEQGRATVSLAQLAQAGQLLGQTVVHCVATDGAQTAYSVAPLPASLSQPPAAAEEEQGEEAAAAAAVAASLNAPLTDVTLQTALPPTEHFTEQRLVRVLMPPAADESKDGAGEGEADSDSCFVLRGASDSAVAAYSTVDTLFALYRGIVGSSLAPFDFLPRWPSLPLPTKQAKFSKFCSHELNLFLKNKDPEFFATIVAPYLANKLQPTFIDLYLLGRPLARFASPAEFGRLNALEKCLLASHLIATGDAADAATARGIARSLSGQAEVSPLSAADFASLFHAAISEEAADVSKCAGDEAEEEGGVPLTVKTVDGSVTLTVPLTLTLAQLKARLEDVLGTPAANQRLLLAGSELRQEEATLESCGVAANARLQLLLGAAGRPSQSADNDTDSGGDDFVMVEEKCCERLMEMEEEDEDDCWDGGAVCSDSDSSECMEESRSSLRSRSSRRRSRSPSPSSSLMSRSLEQRRSAQPLYKGADQTDEHAETNYYQQQSCSLPVSQFWADYANHLLAVADGSCPPTSPFLSTSFAHPASLSLNSALLALAVTDLPFTLPHPHSLRYRKGQLTLTAASPLLLLAKQISGSAPPCQPAVMVAQNYVDPEERTERVRGQRVDKYLPAGAELLRGKVYSCQAVVTNVSSASRKLRLLLQIPQGALPVAGGFFTKGSDISLPAFRSEVVEYSFYFPFTGTFSHFPAHVAEGETLLACAAPPAPLPVVLAHATADTTSWASVSQTGTLEQVLAFLDAAPCLSALPLAKVAWRMRQRDAFCAVVDCLAQRCVYQPTLWAYSLLHRHPQRLREYLAASTSLPSQVGPRFHSWLLRVEPSESERGYQHLEYSPLINARAHRLGSDNEIMNSTFRSQYRSFLTLLCHTPKLRVADTCAAVYYLLLQDRVEEAQSLFAPLQQQQADGLDVPTRLQFDYLTAYLSFFTPSPALHIATPYLEHPVPRVRARFAAIAAHIAEAGATDADAAGAGAASAAEGEEEDRDTRNSKAASASPSLFLSVSGATGSSTLEHRNIPVLTLRYYAMDIELLFSTNPFLATSSGSGGSGGSAGAQFSSIRPNFTQVVAVEAGASRTVVPLPPQFASTNVMVEASGCGLTLCAPLYANSLRVDIMADFGQLKVVEAGSGRPLPRAYVKVFSRSSAGGAAAFFKDGYTDLRGRFDYASLSTDGLKSAARLAILVMTDAHGSVIKETAPPMQ